MSSKRWFLFSLVVISLMGLSMVVHAGGTLPDLQRGLVGHWTFDDAATGRALDSSPFQNHGTVRGATPTMGREGDLDQAFRFETATPNQHIDMGDSEAYRGLSRFTLSMWIYPTSFPREWGSIISKHNTFADGEWYLAVQPNGFRFAHVDRSNILSTMSIEYPIHTNEWMHVALLFDNGPFELYVNGTYVDGGTLGAGTNPTDHPLFIGSVSGRSFNRHQEFRGSIDDVRIYNRALQVEEIHLLNETRETLIRRSLVGHWTFDDAVSGTALDSSPFENHGTVRGASPTQDRNGLSDMAYLFAPTSPDEHIDMGDSSAYRGMSRFTLSMWIHPTSFPREWGTIISKHSLSSNGEWYLAVRSSGFRFAHVDSSNRRTTTHINYPISTEEWIYVTAVYDNGPFQLYVNGSYIGGTTLGPGTRSTNHPLFIGSISGQSFNNNWDFRGSIDRVSIFNQALTAEDVTMLFERYGYSADLQITDLQRGLVGHWTFNDAASGTALDSTHYRNHGTVKGATATMNREGSPNQAFRFEAATPDQHIDMGDSEIYRGLSSFSLAMWIYPTSFPREWGSIISKHNIFADGEWYLAVQSRGFRFAHIDRSNERTSTHIEYPIYTNEWMHVVLLFDNGPFSIYVNGTYVDGGTLGAGTRPTDHPLFIGSVSGRSFNKHQEFRGSIDDVRIYNRALSVQEIKLLSER